MWLAKAMVNGVATKVANRLLWLICNATRYVSWKKADGIRVSLKIL